MLDPLSVWRDALNKWESSSNKLANKEMGSEEFARSMNTLMGMSMGVQQALGKANAALLKELNLPSRAELVELGDRLQRIEDQLVQINRTLSGPAPTTAMPPRTRRPNPPAETAAAAPAAEPTALAAPAEPEVEGASRKAVKPAAKSAKKTAAPRARKGA